MFPDTRYGPRDKPPRQEDGIGSEQGTVMDTDADMAVFGQNVVEKCGVSSVVMTF
jgi:hypothetical protein